jgi:TRAP-type C4-dicarboxylate transport system permease small subunit
MEVNMLWPMSAILVGGLLMLLHYLTRFIRDLKASLVEDGGDLKERREG